MLFIYLFVFQLYIRHIDKCNTKQSYKCCLQSLERKKRQKTILCIVN